jgi:hypothetical protein
MTARTSPGPVGRVVTAVALAAVVGVWASSLRVSADAAENDAADEPRAVAVEEPVSDGVTIPAQGLSADMLTKLDGDGIHVVPASEADRESVIAAKEFAAGLVSEQLAFVQDGTLLAVDLVRMTNDNIGRELEKDLSKPSRIERKFVDRLVWAVEYEGFHPFISGPLGVDTSELREAKAELVAFIDPKTRELLHATQYS